MKKLILTLTFVMGLGILVVSAQNVPATPNPSTPPTKQQDNDVDPAGPDKKDMEFPPDVVDTTITDTSEIPDTRVDSARMENKDSMMIDKDSIRSNWDNSGMKKKNKKSKQ